MNVLSESNSTMERLIEIVKRASAIVTSNFDVTTKDSVTNIVTSNDKAVQEFLKDNLNEMLPGSGFMCEEDDYSITKENTWIIDPIDGTMNYSRGIDFFAISVALKQDDDISLGVVYLPYKDEMFTALRGEGAYYNGKRIKVSHLPFKQALLYTSLCAYNKENLGLCSNIINDTFLQCNDIRRFGSAASELCYMAAGRCELFFEYELYPWDFAAASLILNEAGGCIQDLAGNQPGYFHKTGIIAANNASNLKQLYSIVAKHVKA